MRAGHMADGPWGAYTVDELALRHGVGVEEETSDSELAYARFPKRVPTLFPAARRSATMGR